MKAGILLPQKSPRLPAPHRGRLFPHASHMPPLSLPDAAPRKLCQSILPCQTCGRSHIDGSVKILTPMGCPCRKRKSHRFARLPAAGPSSGNCPLPHASSAQTPRDNANPHIFSSTNPCPSLQTPCGTLLCKCPPSPGFPVPPYGSRIRQLSSDYPRYRVRTGRGNANLTNRCP